MAQSDKVTPKKRRQGESLSPEQIEQAKNAFLADYAKYGNVGHACDKAQISRTTFYRWTEHDEAFSLTCEQSKQDYCDTLRTEIHRRAHDGVLKPVYQRGEKVGTIREYSDTLLIFQAKAHMPEYREKVQVEQSGKVSVQHDLTASPEAALYATLFIAALGAGSTEDPGGPRIHRE